MLMNIGEVSALTHVSIRTLRHYDKIGLLRPTQVTEAGYRQYDETALQRLHTILLFRELEFSLTDIQRIIDAPDFDPTDALEQQITLLTMRREHIDNLILLARGLKAKGLKHMDFSAFDTRKIDDYAARPRLPGARPTPGRNTNPAGSPPRMTSSPAKSCWPCSPNLANAVTSTQPATRPRP